MSDGRGSSSRRSVAISHPRLGWGGSEKRVLWSIQALRDDHDVTLITAGGVDLETLNRYYGTSLRSGDFAVERVRLPAILRGSGRAAALRGAFLQRRCRELAPRFDVLIGGYGPTDFGVPAIHFLADFSWDEELRRTLHPQPPGLVHRNRLARRLYLRLARWLSKPSGRDLFAGEDRMLAVSPWVARTMKDRHGLECEILPSPVPGSISRRPLAARRHAFVCLGRLSPEKRLETAVAIVEGLRARGHAIDLHLVGSGDDRVYAESLTRLCEERGDWITLHGRLVGPEKVEVLTGVRFGLHACHGDAFPGAVVEMMKAGCVVWGHRSGGVVEILGEDDLLFLDVPDAVQKIDRVLADPLRQTTLQGRLVERSARYSVERFMVRIRSLVTAWTACTGSSSAQATRGQS